MYSEAIVQKLNETAHTWQPIIYREIHEVISQERYVNSGKSAESLKVEVIEGNASRAPQFDIKFDDSLLFLDKRKLQWTKLPNMKKLLEWASHKESDPKKAKRLAWATAYDKKKNDTWKAKPWRKKSLSSTLKELNKFIIQLFEDTIEIELQDAIRKGINA